MDAGNAWLKKRSEAWMIVLGLAGIALVDLLDYLTPADVRFAIIYLVPIMAAAWFGGARAGIIAALASAFSRLLLELFVYPTVPRAWVPYFNLVVLSCVFSVVAVLASSMRHLIERYEDWVAQRTSELERDISERKRVEAALAEKEERFRLFMDNSAMIAFVKDEAGRYQYVNSTFQKRFDFPLVGKSVFDVFPREVATQLHEKDTLVFASGQTLEFADSIPFPDGTVTDWINYKFPFRDSGGRLFVGCVSVEITQQRRLEKQLLEISDREQARIGYDLHDQLCQFLVGILFHCQDLSETLRRARRPETAGAERIAELINSAITQARQLARGLFPALLEREGLVPALEEFALGIKGRFKTECSVQCENPVSIREEFVANHLYRIAQEAVNNAARHAHARQITIHLGASASALELAVTDDGVGMTNGSRGHGMGLHIMNYRAHTIGGTLEIKSPQDKGTSIVCRVPLEKI